MNSGMIIKIILNKVTLWTEMSDKDVPSVIMSVPGVTVIEGWEKNQDCWLGAIQKTIQWELTQELAIRTFVLSAKSCHVDGYLFGLFIAQQSIAFPE